MKPIRTYERLMQLECYAYERWRYSLHTDFCNTFWYRLATACNRAVKAHPDYRGKR